jgi:hypothetical protein
MKWKFLSYLFDDWLSRCAGIILTLLTILTLFAILSNIPDQHPLLGVFIFGLVPILFIAGGIVFILAVLKYV